MAGSSHGGNLREISERSGCPPGRILDASANLNPLGPPEWLDAAFNEGRANVTRYPDPDYDRLRKAAATRLGLDPATIVFGNGADELMFALARALMQGTEGGQEHFITEPCYASYREASESSGATVVNLPYKEIFSSVPGILKPGSVAWVVAPNNPTGTMPDDYPRCVVEAARRNKRAFFAVDEAFIDFAEGYDPEDTLTALSRESNIIVIRSMTKFWCVPGIRAGYAVCNPALAALLRSHLPNWPLNSIAEAFAIRAFCDDTAMRRRESTRALITKELCKIREAFADIRGLTLYPSSANFYIVKIDDAAYTGDIADALLGYGIAVRRCINFAGMDSRYARLAVRTAEENDSIIAALRGILSGFIAKPRQMMGPKKKTKALMIQGCSSSAGKSLITAAFCRIFRDEGIDVAPYKAQNMSLNSAVTPEGLEIGRAQAVQAAACGLDPNERMNPVLLKPESDRGSQVILLGKPYARYQAKDYYSMHEFMKKTARDAYDSLASDHELIVLEGAGSPAEINLKSRDFVNMGAALHARAKVLLVGDIDRGGVFASFIGHASTFTPAELDIFLGFIVNKFRGDPELLGDAFAMTRDRTGYPVLGCIPMLSDMDIPDEDEPVIKARTDSSAAIRIAVARLPRVSNFTDMDAFAGESDVSINAVRSGAELASGNFDAIILPGTKSTVADLRWLRETGLADAVLTFAKGGGTITGICGGYQMMGERIADPDLVESSEKLTKGLGLLPVVTTFSKDKKLSRMEGIWKRDGIKVRGYEIHHGDTEPFGNGSCVPVILSSAGEALGYGDDRIWGSYLHGVFDSDEFRSRYLNLLRIRKNLAPLPPSKKPSLDAELDKLADAVRRSVDLSSIRKALGL